MLEGIRYVKNKKQFQCRSNYAVKGKFVPLFKGKVDMGDPHNYRPLCILSHASKVVQKAIVIELGVIVAHETEKAQFGFQE